ncbi:hypothetical protein FOA52_011905, partial [Chlamydomonas sp. UWO 241]
MDAALNFAVRGECAAAVETLLRPWPIEQLPLRRRSDNPDDDYVDGVYMPNLREPRQAAPSADTGDIVWQAVYPGASDVLRLLLSLRDPPPDVANYVAEACIHDRPNAMRIMLEMQ